MEKIHSQLSSRLDPVKAKGVELLIKVNIDTEGQASL
jgi:hypothetical protein